jgi:hypothetical protein
MNTRLLAAVVLAIGPPLWASGALAAQITFGPSAEHNFHGERGQLRDSGKPEINGACA